MKTLSTFLLLVFSILCAVPRNSTAQSKTKKTTITIPAETVVDKIRGGLLGQIIGNVNGMPYEFKYYEAPGKMLKYIPALPDGGLTDDDTDFEWVYIHTMQKQRNVFLPYKDINALWTSRINRNIWCANRYARYLMDLGIEPPLTGNIALNPWAEFNLSGQFLCETYGLMAPAMPQTAAKIGLHYTKVAIDHEPAQTTQLFTTMVSTAFIESDVNKILDAGIASLDPSSIMVKIIADVRQWHRENPEDWQEVHRLIHTNYEQKDNLTRNRNGSELNTAAIIAALLYGKGDFAESVRHSFNFGYDADCNAATVGTIIGTTYGYRRMLSEGWKIVDRYKNTNRDNMPMDETITSFADRVVDMFELVNENNGGKKSVLNKTVVYSIPSEKPASILKLSSVPEQKIALKKQLGKEITANLLKGNKQEKARAAYMAVCFDMADDLKTQYPEQWKEACYNLSGYWKVMNNIFYGDNFKSLLAIRDKFAAQGFVKPPKAAKSDQLFVDMEVWKDPELAATK